LLLVTSAFVGCIGGGDDSPVNQTSTLPEDNQTTPDGVNRFTPGNETVEVPDAEKLGDPAYGLTGFGGAEPSMGITESGALFAAADNQMIRSTDRGASWEVVQSVPIQTDPLMYVDKITDTVYFDPMFPTRNCSALW